MSSVYMLARGGSSLAGWTPRPVRYVLGSAISGASYLGWRSKRLVTQQNMAQISRLPVEHPQVRRMAFASWRNYGRYASDFMYFPHFDMDRVERESRDMSLDGCWKDHMQAALQPGKGVIVATAHFGNWDMAGAVVARHFPLAAVAETFADARLNELLQGQRKEKGMDIIPMEGSARRILRALQQNHGVAIVIDRPVAQEQGVEITFFGRKTYVPGGPAALALKSGAAILSGYAWYGHHHQFYLRACTPIFPRECKGPVERDREIARLTQSMYNYLEGVIRDWPTQWYMFRPFWPTVPIS